MSSRLPSVWDAMVEEALNCMMDINYSKDRFAVAVKRNNTIVSLVPHEIKFLNVIFWSFSKIQQIANYTLRSLLLMVPNLAFLLYTPFNGY